MAKLNAEEYKTFESIKKLHDNGVEFWYARELASVLEYAKWENFSKVIDRAMLACKNSGYAVSDHFPEVRKMVEIGSGAKREKMDYELSRYACYLIVQNGDPRKEVIALGQTYFAIQTRRARLRCQQHAHSRRQPARAESDGIGIRRTGEIIVNSPELDEEEWE